MGPLCQMLHAAASSHMLLTEGGTVEAEPWRCLLRLTLGTSAPVDHARPTANRAMDTAAAEKTPAPEMSNMSRLLREEALELRDGAEGAYLVVGDEEAGAQLNLQQLRGFPLHLLSERCLQIHAATCAVEGRSLHLLSSCCLQTPSCATQACWCPRRLSLSDTFTGQARPWSSDLLATKPKLTAVTGCSGVAAEHTLRSQATTLCPSSWEACVAITAAVTGTALMKSGAGSKSASPGGSTWGS